MTLAMFKTRKKLKKIEVGPDSNGMLMTPREFDSADFEHGWRYELINGLLIVSSLPSESEMDSNEELGIWLRNLPRIQSARHLFGRDPLRTNDQGRLESSPGGSGRLD